jgi:hypothetical protein
MKRLALAALACAALAATGIADPLAGYEPVDLSDYQPRESASAVMLLQDLFEGHPESHAEGRPVLKIDLKQTEDRSALLIDLEMTGYLDDSVDGQNSTAPSWSRARSTCSGWRGWARRSNAAAADNAGQWTTGNCP